jgi:hypothetical protein
MTCHLCLETCPGELKKPNSLGCTFEPHCGFLADEICLWIKRPLKGDNKRFFCAFKAEGPLVYLAGYIQPSNQVCLSVFGQAMEVPLPCIPVSSLVS